MLFLEEYWRDTQQKWLNHMVTIKQHLLTDVRNCRMLPPLVSVCVYERVVEEFRYSKSGKHCCHWSVWLAVQMCKSVGAGMENNSLQSKYKKLERPGITSGVSGGLERKRVLGWVKSWFASFPPWTQCRLCVDKEVIKPQIYRFHVKTETLRGRGGQGVG